MRPFVRVVETKRGYVVVRGRRRSRAFREFPDAVAEAERLASGVPMIWGPGDVPDADVVMVGYPAAEVLAEHRVAMAG